MNTLQIVNIRSAIKAALRNIKNNYREHDSKQGWHQYLGTEKIGNIASAQALMLFSVFNEDFNKSYLVFKTLFDNQFFKENDSRIDGGWGYATNFSTFPTTEATSWVLQSLYSEFRNSLAAQKGLLWLINNHIDGVFDEGWGTIKIDQSRVYSTCLVLKTLKMYGRDKETNYHKGLNWLLKAQNTDSGWGDRFGFPSSISHTSQVIITLKFLGIDNDHEKLNLGIEWLKLNTKSVDLMQKNPKLGFQELMEFNYIVNGKYSNVRLVYNHMPLQLASTALIVSGNFASPVVFEIINHLLKNHNNFFWSHPVFANDIRKPMWAIYETLQLFEAVNNIADKKPAKLIELRGRKLVFINSDNPFNIIRFINNFVLGIWGKLFFIVLICVIMTKTFEIFPDLKNQVFMAFVILPLIIELAGYYLTELKKKNDDI